MSHTIRVYGDIGEGYYSNGISASAFADALDAVPLSENAVDIRVNSFGGLTADGLAMMNVQKAWMAKRKSMAADFKVVCHIDGYAYSAASIFPLSADEIVMHGGSLMMIHNAWFNVSGDYREMQSAADYLMKVSGELAKLYASKTGMDVKKVQTLMDDETFFTGEEAVAAKLVNSFDGGDVGDDAKAVYKGLNFKKGVNSSYKQFITAAKARKVVANPLKRDDDFARLVGEFEKLIA
jgi:ATP-dependent Clp protease protease subunit